VQPAHPSAQETIAAIRSAFSGSDSGKASEIAKSRVLEWMRSPDLEVRGALYSMISNSERASHVKPALEFDDYYGFVLDYLEQCIEHNPDGEWADSRYLAGHQLVAWIVDFWNNKSVPRTRLAEIKRRLGDLYRRGDEDVRDGVLNGVLEHLFENRQLANYFKDWESDPVLARVYSDALLWTKKNFGGA
jgi:hypothetical protein